MKKNLIAALMMSFCLAAFFGQEATDSDTANQTENQTETVTTEKESTKVKFGGGMTPGLTKLGFCNYFLKPRSLLSVSGNMKATPVYKGGIGSGFHTGTKTITADTYHYFTPGKLFEFSTFDNVSFQWNNKFKPYEFYTGNMAKIKPFNEGSFLKSIYVTSEYLFDMNENTTKDFISTVGLQTYLTNNHYSFLLVEPYAFVSGFDFSDLNLGAGLDFKSSYVLANIIGLHEHFSVRYAAFNFAGNTPYTRLLYEDYFRGTRRNETEKAQFTFSSETKLFYNSPDFNLKFPKFLQFQIGPVFDLSWNNDWAWLAGGLTRSRIGFGGSPMMLELGYAYSSVKEKCVVLFGFSNIY